MNEIKCRLLAAQIRRAGCLRSFIDVRSLVKLSISIVWWVYRFSVSPFNKDPQIGLNYNLRKRNIVGIRSNENSIGISSQEIAASHYFTTKGQMSAGRQLLSFSLSVRERKRGWNYRPI